MAWLELHQSVTTHAKTLELCDQLDLPEYAAVGLLSCLWLWALDNAPDGVLPDAPRRIARAIRWDKDADDLIAALIEAGYLHQTAEGLEIHNWHEYAGKLLDRRQSNANRQKEYRERKKTPDGNDTVTDEKPLLQHNDNVTDTLPSRNGATDQTRPDRPNQTEPDQTDQTDRAEKSSSVPEKVKFIERTLTENPHWEPFLDEQVAKSHPAPSRVVGFKVSVLRNWLDGDGTPPFPGSSPPPNSAAPPSHPFANLPPEEQQRRGREILERRMREDKEFYKSQESAAG